MTKPVEGTAAERIVHTLRISGRPWDDDQLTKQLGISQRQTVNQICRRLAAEGRIQRYVGEGGKLVNALSDARTDEVPAAATREIKHTSLATASPGGSAEQRAAEVLMIAEASGTLGVDLAPQSIITPSGARVEIDGVDDARSVLVEAWGHQGPPKVAQKHKVLADALKLSWIASTLPKTPRLVLCFSDAAAAKPFREGRSWAAAALREMKIEVLVVELPASVRANIVEAQRRQYR